MATTLKEQNTVRPRATLGRDGNLITVLVDGIIVGQSAFDASGRASCTALMNELNESDEKCDILIETETQR